jgi:hypothetical protein
MKIRLLKKLRKRFKITYYPGKGIYSLYTGKTLFWDCRDLESALEGRQELILSHARINYKKYGKSIQIN